MTAAADRCTLCDRPGCTRDGWADPWDADSAAIAADCAAHEITREQWRARAKAAEQRAEVAEAECERLRAIAAERDADERDAEWQRRIMFHLGLTVGGDGCDSGDPIDWTIAAIRRHWNRVMDAADAKIAELTERAEVAESIAEELMATAVVACEMLESALLDAGLRKEAARTIRARLAELGAALMRFAATPTGERRPCGAWYRDGNTQALDVGGARARAMTDYRGASWNVVPLIGPTLSGRAATMEAAMLAAEDAARDLLLAGLRVLGGEAP